MLKTIQYSLAGFAMLYGAVSLAQAPIPEKINDWKNTYPLEYYSILAGADDIDDLDDKNFGYSHSNMAINLMKSIAASQKAGGLNATCFSCKSVRFNDIYKKYGNEVFQGKKSVNYAEMLRPTDFWSCETCHADMTNPKNTVGAQILTPSLFGKALFDKLPPKAAACAQCHNNLAPWSDSRIIIAENALKNGKYAYRYGWDPDGMIKATLEDAMSAGVRYPEGKVYETSPAAHAKVDKELGIYLIANGNHADAELYMDSIHYRMNVGCADCHMPFVKDRLGTTSYRTHNASKTPLNSRASMEFCLTCHKNDSVKNVKDMVGFVKAAQAKVAAKDKVVADLLDQTFVLLQKAIKEQKLSKESIEAAKFNYAKASYYKEYVHGNRGATPGGKVAHNPELSHKYLDQAADLLRETQKLLQAN
ncbi:MAG: ammonia-forming cytochrome c nitrite reductase subunit c552 [Parasutterella excrementihominis]|jgi:nitrite reductase (cytochrome; ammonia-forming)|uniref:ammonia-forming cytochrome c nitrite reductase subunit c552 n=1 Tax=Parasutterella excrementihominis TaxID=487175 RepID=UPI00399ABAB3